MERFESQLVVHKKLASPAYIEKYWLSLSSNTCLWERHTFIHKQIAQPIPYIASEVLLHADREHSHCARQSQNFNKQSSTTSLHTGEHITSQIHTHCLRQQNPWHLLCKYHTRHHTPPHQHTSQITLPTQGLVLPVTASLWAPYRNPHFYAQNRTSPKLRLPSLQQRGRYHYTAPHFNYIGIFITYTHWITFGNALRKF